MTDRPAPNSEVPIVLARSAGGDDGADERTPIEPGAPDGEISQEAIERPAKVMRIGAMIKQLLDEIRQTELDDASRKRVREVYEHAVRELADTLSPDLTAELGRLALPFETDQPTDAELRVAQAQLVGWLEGLFNGIQATIFAQQMAAQAQLEQMRRRSLPAGALIDNAGGGEDQRRPGTGAYL